MGQRLFAGQTEVRARAMYVGQRLELRAFEQAQRLAASPLLVSVGASGAAVLFRYGVVVLFGLDAMAQTRFMAGLEPLVIEPFDKAEAEDVDLAFDAGRVEGMEQSLLVLKDAGIARLQLVASVLAKSAVLTRYETNIAESFDHIEPLAARLQRGGRGVGRGEQLLRHIGDTLIIHGRMVGRVEISEKPDLLWENPELERLYAKLEDEYELGERHLALERKLDLIMRTAETLLDLLHHQRSLRVEWYIVILIVVEIALTLYQMHF
jgi:uncharacterized Rmd1/YagE family protein